MQHITTIGLDLAKHVFQLHGMDHEGRVVLCKKLRRGQVLKFFATLPVWSKNSKPAVSRELPSKPQYSSPTFPSLLRSPTLHTKRNTIIRKKAMSF